MFVMFDSFPPSWFGWVWFPGSSPFCNFIPGHRRSFFSYWVILRFFFSCLAILRNLDFLLQNFPLFPWSPFTFYSKSSIFIDSWWFFGKATWFHNFFSPICIFFFSSRCFILLISLIFTPMNIEFFAVRFFKIYLEVLIYLNCLKLDFREKS